MVLLCGEDDDKLQNAAAGALAMLTGAHKKLCFKMTEVVRAGPGAQHEFRGKPGSEEKEKTWDTEGSR